MPEEKSFYNLNRVILLRIALKALDALKTGTTPVEPVFDTYVDASVDASVGASAGADDQADAGKKTIKPKRRRVKTRSNKDKKGKR